MSKRPIQTYTHKDKERLNNPPVGLVTPETDREEAKKRYAYDPHLDPQLVWAGKAEHTSFEVPTVSLHVHERIEPRTIIEALRKRNGNGPQQYSLFAAPEENPPIRQAIEFYKHKHNWTNRLIAGDSLLVMNSLLEKEGLAGQVQMVYIDPPYGIKYGSNFQPFVNKRDVKDGKDEDLSQEPEMIRAFRDTWELGIHSYLTYLRDRLLLARELLADSGSIFVQIGVENLHRVREMMDEVLGQKNFVSQIAFQTTPYATSNFLAPVYDSILWYGKDISKLKYRQIFLRKEDLGKIDAYRFLESPNGDAFRTLTKEELQDNSLIPKGWKRFQSVSLISQGATSSPQEFEFEGRKWKPPANSHWKVTIEGLEKVKNANRIFATENSLRFKSYLTDFPVTILHNIWTDMITGSFTEAKQYVVQTNPRVVERCISMTTDPGDLVLDPTCGSGTTAYVAEQWGRRWITCDTSRVASRSPSSA
jgi:Adenine specific DNA methylase Mod